MIGRQETADFEVADLRHLSATDLDALLVEEGTLWREKLDWDFTASADLVRHFTGRRMLSGNAYIASGVVAGYGYFVADEHKGLIGDLYVRRGTGGERAEMLLLETIVRRLMAWPQVHRIESQLMLLEDALSRPLPASSYAQVHERYFMSVELPAPQLKPASIRADVGIESWNEWRQPEVAALIAGAYRNHIDSQINDQYRSMAGARRFLINIVQYPGCGAFFAPASFLAVHSSTGGVCGACLTSLVAAHTGHITQVCVEPAMQGTGLGYELVRRSLAVLADHGCSRASLTVTRANRNAVALYQRMGFTVRRSFAAYVWDGF
ncbi:MAG: GNAT family N-acetyltransferase [Acidobacteriales bacterium]|nr:GNAT family N-acetyltransferase [Terriglobales bacterium]